MHIFIPRSDVDLGPTEPAVKAGTEFVLDDLMAAQLMSLAGGGEMRSLDVYQGAAHRGGPARRMNKVSHELGSTLFLRAGGFGDLIGSVLGGFFGSYIAANMSRRERPGMVMPLAVAAFLIIGAMVNFFVLFPGQPAWLMVATIGLYVPVSLLGRKLAY